MNVSVWRRFFGTSRLVSVLKVERLGLVSVLRVQRLGLEDITSLSRSRDFSLVNMRAMHQAWGYIMKKIMDLTRKKTICEVTDLRFLERLGLASRSQGGLETFFRTSRLVSVLKVERLGLEILKKWNVSVRATGNSLSKTQNSPLPKKKFPKIPVR